MKTHIFPISLLTATLVFLLLSSFTAISAYAQTNYSGVGEKKSLRDQRDDHLAKKSETKKNKTSALYPDATRVWPEVKPTRKNRKALKKLEMLYTNKKYPEAMEITEEIISNPSSNAYDKSYVYQIAGAIASENGDKEKTAEYLEQAIAMNGLDNDSHFNAMRNLAVTRYGLEQNEQALQVFDRYFAESGSKKSEDLNLHGALLTKLERYDEAIALYTQLMIDYPDEKSYVTNAVATYQQSGQFDKAAELLNEMRAKSSLSTSEEYRFLYVSHINGGALDKAIVVIDEGLKKGVIKQNDVLARDYMLLAQKAYYAENDLLAIEGYKRAASIAKDGEPDLNLARVYSGMNETNKAKAAAKQAIKQGVKDMKSAKRLAENGR